MTTARTFSPAIPAQRWLLSLLIFGGLGLVVGQTALAQLPQAVDGQALPSLAPMVERISPAVVNISSKTRVRVRDPFADDPFFQRFFGVPSAPRERIQQSLGSGVIIDASQGHVLTNNHVIDGADDIEVTLADGRTLKARLIGTDPDSDVALIEIPAERLSAVPLADSSGLRVGDFVVAIGNPFGLGQTVTSGIVSALGRSGLQGLGVQNFIQTDASINPGNSGGALVNLRGELVGINTAIFSPSGGNVGIGFAVPSALAADVLDQLLKFGEVRRGSLGVELQDVTADLAPMLGLQAPRGAVVTKVTAQSAAARAGLKVGDVVVAVNQRRIDSAADLINTEALLPIDKPVFLGVVREQKPLTLNAVLTPEILRTRPGSEIDPRLTGATLGDLASKQRRKGLTGARVAALREGSRAAQNGLAEGDLIVAANQYNLRDLASLERVLEARPNRLILTVLRNGRAFYVEMQ
ncbi:MAG: DegQ family serine endoprotease [Lysobacterales bacterium]